MTSKLTALKSDLNSWNEEMFGNIERQKKLLLEELRELYLLEEKRTLCD